MVRGVSKNYTWVCPRIPHCFCVCCFSESHSSVTGLKFKCRLFPPCGPDIYLLFTSIYIHIPRMVGRGGGHVLTLKRAVLPRGLKVLLSCIWGMIKQGGWLLQWLPWGQWWERQGSLFPFLSPFLSPLGGTGRKLVWLRGRRRTKGHCWRASRPQCSSLIPPLARYTHFALHFPKRRPSSTLFSHLAALPQQNSKSPSLLLCYMKLKISTPLELLLH